MYGEHNSVSRSREFPEESQMGSIQRARKIDSVSDPGEKVGVTGRWRIARYLCLPLDVTRLWQGLTVWTAPASRGDLPMKDQRGDVSVVGRGLAPTHRTAVAGRSHEADKAVAEGFQLGDLHGLRP